MEYGEVAMANKARLNFIREHFPDLIEFFDLYTGNFIIPVSEWRDEYAAIEREYPEEYKVFYFADGSEFEDDPFHAIACREFWD